MPPSYSMMLPGRMSTPLIFMSSLGEMWGKSRSLALAGGLLPGKQRVRIDRRALPPALTRRHRVDRQVKVRAGGACVPCVPDPGDHLTALDLLSFGQPRRVGRQVGIIIHPLLVGRALV